MRKKKAVKTYFQQHPEALEALKQKAQRALSDQDQPSDDAIPSFNEFLARYEVIACCYNNNRKATSNRLMPRVLVPVSLVLLFCFFVAFTTPGHSLAESLYKTVVQWFDGGAIMRQWSAVDVRGLEVDGAGYYDSIEDLPPGLAVAYNPQADLCDKIKIERIESSIQQVSMAYLYEGYEFLIVQIALSNYQGFVDMFETCEGQLINETQDSGINFVGYVSEDAAYAVAYINNMSVRIFAEDVDYDSFVAFIRGIEVK